MLFNEQVKNKLFMLKKIVMKIFIACFFIGVLLFTYSGKLHGQNVGVNTLTPKAALDINGDIIIRPAELTAADGITLALDVNTVRFSYYRVTGPH